MVKLALVDDDFRLLESLRLQLSHFPEIESIVTSLSGLQFVREMAGMKPEHLPDIIIMDISMNVPDEGIRATRKIKERFPQIEIIMFTISDRDDLIFEAFKAGAMGYLLKGENPEFIVKTILDVKAGNAQMSPGIARKTINYLTKDTRSAEEASVPTEPLSDRELEILHWAAKGHTYLHIGNQLHISPSTVKKHMTNIFGKLHVRNKIEALLKTGELDSH